ncbi:hypothetical protein ACHQM5_006780 [Ranunculus cassubicifolius]
MLQCRAFQNYSSGSCFHFSTFGNGGNYSKCAQIKFRKAEGNYGMNTGGSLVGSSFVNYRHNFAVSLRTHVRVSNSFPGKCIGSYSCRRVDSNVRLNFSSQEYGGRRFFSGKATGSSGSKNRAMKVSGYVSGEDGKIALKSIPLKLSDCFRRPANSFRVRSSKGSSQPAEESTSDVTQSAPKKRASKPKGGKKVVKVVSSVSTPLKASGNNKAASGQVKTKQIGSKKEEAPLDSTDAKVESSVSSSTKNKDIKKPSPARGKKKPVVTKKEQTLPDIIPPSDAVINGSKQASPVKKATVKKIVGKSSQILPAGETSVENSTLTPQKAKKTNDQPAKKRKSQKKAPTKVKGDAVLVEVKHRPMKEGLRPLYPPTGKSVVVVESLTKAKVIQGYLGNMFEVLPSYGHVRDLAGRSGSVRPDDDFSMVWEVPSAAWTHLKSIKVALNGAENLILASDPDREGEAIAWHITEMLQQQDALNDNINVSRVVFHEITEASIKSALQTPRDIDANLVHAYLARRALDYLIGFTISPLLWRKLPACQSAGRVQSAALALLCDREIEVDEFKPQEYWTVNVEFNETKPGSSAKAYSFPSHLTHLDCKKLEQLSISSSEAANAVEKKLTSSDFEVLGSKRSKTRRNPPIPYITSTLQQDAANKLQFSAAYTMKLAQKLYEGVKLADNEATGLITYMRTDGLHVSDVAANDIHSLVIERYGKDYASENTRKYFKKVKNAQEAHEAIRPTSIRRLPSTLTRVLDEDSLKLYTLIWSRTMACQMVPTVIEQIQIDIGGAESSLGLRSTCSRVEFHGYQAVYKDAEAAPIGNNEVDQDARDAAFEVLSKLKTGDLLRLGKVDLKQHFTQPPPRYSEGSLVKKLEELGIGRPSTYASTIKVLQDRNYVTVKSRTLHPEFRGRMVSAFLGHHFTEVTDYSFTADMETELDNVSAGTTEWKGLLKDYWTRFKAYCDRAGKVDIRQVEKMLEKTFEDFLFSALPSRTCPSCSEGKLVFKVSRFGAGYFIGCDAHPKCKYIAKTIYGDNEDPDPDSDKTQFQNEAKLIGLHPTSNEQVLLKSGPYGLYVQLGEDRKGFTPKRASVSKLNRKNVDNLSLEDALELLQYPRVLGDHPDDGCPVMIKISRDGFSIRHRRTIAPVPKNLDPKTVTLEKALTLLLSKDVTRSGRPKNKPKPVGFVDEVYVCK